MADVSESDERLAYYLGLREVLDAAPRVTGMNGAVHVEIPLPVLVTVLFSLERLIARERISRGRDGRGD